MTREATLTRFWSYVQKTADCWLWTGYQNGAGYGRFYVGDDAIYAHRFAYETERESIPPGMVIDHLCRVRNCVNPAHLEPVTSAENTRRGARGRLVAACPKGHPYTPENTYVTPNGRWRKCRACNRANAARIKARKLRERSGL